MRIIDADALLAEFDRREAEPEYQHEGEDWYCGLISGEELVMEAPTIETEQRWIPCSERLPEVHESGNSFSGIYMQSYPVLVYGICEGEENAQFHVATYCDDLDGNTYWSTELDAFTITEVKAYMPLPEPYGGEQE